MAGDFNAEDHEAALRIAIGSEDDTGNGALAGYMMIPVDRNLPGDRRYSVTHHGRPVMLDHILASRSLMGFLRSVDIHNEALFDELIGPSRIEQPPDSFHAPLVAEFALAG
jgi:predicted extracellular nuclease